jgi:hypothetical protein
MRRRVAGVRTAPWQMELADDEAVTRIEADLRH